jgi:2-iminobutanoate/2-iminopropanoate deaminase
MKTIMTARAPAPVGHYAQAIIHNGLVFVSGQLPINPRTHEKQGETIEEQTEQTLKNLSAILMAAETDINHILKTTVYITDLSLFPAMNKTYASFFGEHQPTRATAPVKELPGGCLIEIDAIATLPG